MSAELRQYIAQCETSSKYESKKQKETLMSHEIAECPWEKIGTDLYTIDGNEYLIVVDYFSDFWDRPPNRHESQHCDKEEAQTILQ